MRSFRGIAQFVASAAAVALVATSCGNSLSDSAAVASSTTEPASASATTSTSPPSTTATTPTTTAAPATTAEPTTTAPTTSAVPTTTTEAPVTTTTAVACLGDGVLPGDAANHSLAAGDVDGDGLLDTIHTYTLDDPSVPGAWWTQISFAAGGGTAAQIWDSSTSYSGATPVDGMDINGDGRDEFFIYLGGAGSEAKLLGLFMVDGCTIDRVGYATDIASSPPPILTVTYGITCADTDGNGGVDVLTVSTGPMVGVEGDVTITRRRFSLVDGSLVDRGTDAITVPLTDPATANIGKVICDGVVWS